MKRALILRIVLGIIPGIILTASPRLFAQDSGNAVYFQSSGTVATVGVGIMGKGQFAPVQGAPYSATITNESIQTLGDGTKITQTISGNVARDAQGRHPPTAEDETVEQYDVDRQPDGVVEQGGGFGLTQARGKALADEPTLAVAAIRVESVAYDRLAVADHVGDHGYHRAGHFRKIDVGVGNRRGDRHGFFSDLGDSHTILQTQNRLRKSGVE